MMVNDSLWSTLLHAKFLLNDMANISSKTKMKRTYLDVIDLYIKAIDKMGESAEIYASVAECYFKMESVVSGDDEKVRCFDQAIDWAQKAISVAPETGELHAFLGMLYFFCRLDYKASADEYRKAIALSPLTANLYADAAHINDYHSPDSTVTIEEEINWLEKCVQLEPTNPDNQAFLSNLYFEAGRFDDAKKAALLALISHKPIQQGYLDGIKSHLLPNV